MVTGHSFSREFFRNHFIQWMFLVGLFLNIVSLVFTVYYFRPRTTSILMRSNVYLGLDLQSLSPWYYAYLIPAAGFFFLSVHTLWALRVFSKKDRITAHLMLLSATFLEVGVLIATASLILLNMSE